MLQTDPNPPLPGGVMGNLRRKSLTNISKCFSASSLLPVSKVFSTTQPNYSYLLNSDILSELEDVTWIK